jgi:hypothetical protein
MGGGKMKDIDLTGELVRLYISYTSYKVSQGTLMSDIEFTDFMDWLISVRCAGIK